MTQNWVLGTAEELRAELAARGAYLSPAAAQDHVAVQRARMAALMRISEPDAQKHIAAAHVRQWAADLADDQTRRAATEPADRS